MAVPRKEVKRNMGENIVAEPISVLITGAPKEIAALVVALQERQDSVRAEDIARVIADGITERLSFSRTP